MGIVTAPVCGSGSWPAWMQSVEKPMSFFLSPTRVNPLRHVPLAGVGDQRDDAFAAAEAVGHFECGGDVCAGGGGAENAFFGRQTRHHVECGIVVDANDVGG